MALRYATTGSTVGVAGKTYTHGITKAGVSTAPNFWNINYSTAAGVPAGASAVYKVGVTSTTITWASTSGDAIVDMQCSYSHSITGGVTTT